MAETNAAPMSEEDRLQELAKQYIPLSFPDDDKGDEHEERETETVTSTEEEFPADLLQRASEYGMTEADVRDTYPSAKALRGALALADRQLAQQALAPRQQPQQQQPQVETKKRDRKALPSKEEINEHLITALEEIRAELDELHTAKELHHGAIDHTMRGLASHDQQAFTARMDSYFQGLDASYEDVLGKGTGDDVADQHGLRSSKMANRMQLAEAMMALQKQAQASGRNPSEKQLFHQALRALFGERAVKQAKEAARKELETNVKQRSQSVTARAQGPAVEKRALSAADRKRNAERNVAALLKKRGWYVGGDE